MLNILKDKTKKDGEPINKRDLVTFLNPYSYLLARQNLDLFEKFDRIYIDGIALVKILNLFRVANVKRTSFDATSLVPNVFMNAMENSRSLYFIGTKPEIIDETIKNIGNEYQGLNIVGYRDGYIKDNERTKLLKDIEYLKPDIVVCGMGTPLQEKFLIDLRLIGWSGEGYTCGGFLHQAAVKINYYPSWVNKYNLRWAYRMYDEPKLVERYLIGYPKFFMIFLYDYMKWKFFNK